MSFGEHWTKDLNAWFESGIDTPGLILVEVNAERLHYWQGMDQGDLRLDRPGRATSIRE